MDDSTLSATLQHINQGMQLQQTSYPCGCTLTGKAPLPIDCPTHQLVRTQEKPEILVSVILDESGSMSTVRQKTIDGFNEYLHGLKQDGSKYLFTLTKFDSRPNVPTCRIEYQNKPIIDVPLLTSDSYVPTGGTPLCDAVGETVSALKQSCGGRAVLVVVLTDGGENSSHAWTKAKVKELIQSCEASGNWTFVYVGANQDAWAEASVLGFSSGNVANFAVQNVSHVMSNLRSATVAYAGNVMRGASMTSSYFGDAGIVDVNTPGGTDPSQLASYFGSQGGTTSSGKLTEEERKVRASLAARARWHNSKSDSAKK